MQFVYQNGEPDIVYFPYKDKDEEGLDNVNQTTKVSETTKNLYVVIDPENTVDDIYSDYLV